jgi:hypothetical protein
VWKAGPQVLGKPAFTFIDYIRLSLSFADKINVISHNARGYDIQFLLRRFLELIWDPNLIMDGNKFLTMFFENFQFLNLMTYLPESKEHSQTIRPNMQEGVLPHSSKSPAN